MLYENYKNSKQLPVQLKLLFYFDKMVFFITKGFDSRFV